MPGELNHSFFIPLQPSFFTQYGKHLIAQPLKKQSVMPFKDHAQFPLLMDILSRKNTHHIFLEFDASPKLHFIFLEALLSHCYQQASPKSLREAEIIYLDTFSLLATKTKQKTVEKE